MPQTKPTMGPEPMRGAIPHGVRFHAVCVRKSSIEKCFYLQLAFCKHVLLLESTFIQFCVRDGQQSSVTWVLHSETSIRAVLFSGEAVALSLLSLCHCRGLKVVPSSSVSMRLWHNLSQETRLRHNASIIPQTDSRWPSGHVPTQTHL